MAGLRERKKENRKKRIFECALKLFEQQGFEKTTMEKIANDAELGVGTLYNYYPSKVVLLFSIIEAGSGKYVEELDDVILKCGNIKEAVFEFYKIYLTSFATYGKRVWSELFKETLFRQQNAVNMIDIIDKKFIDKLKELLTACKSRGVIRENADVSVSASALYALLGFNIIQYISIGEMTSKQLTESLTSQSGLIVDALVKPG